MPVNPLSCLGLWCGIDLPLNPLSCLGYWRGIDLPVNPLSCLGHWCGIDLPLNPLSCLGYWCGIDLPVNPLSCLGYWCGFDLPVNHYLGCTECRGEADTAVCHEHHRSVSENTISNSENNTVSWSRPYSFPSDAIFRQWTS